MGQGEKGADMAVGIQTIPAAALHTTDQAEVMQAGVEQPENQRNSRAWR